MSDVFDVLRTVTSASRAKPISTGGAIEEMPQAVWRSPMLGASQVPAALSRGGWGVAAEGRHPPAGAAIKEALNQIEENVPGECAVQKRSINGKLPAQPGEVGNHRAGVGITKDKPRLAFVGHPPVGLKGKPGLPQCVKHAMEMR